MAVKDNCKEVMTLVQFHHSGCLVMQGSRYCFSKQALLSGKTSPFTM